MRRLVLTAPFRCDSKPAIISPQNGFANDAGDHDPEDAKLHACDDIVHDWDDPDDFSWWQPAFDVLRPPDAEKEAS
jgi:hypothetical protein